LVLEDEMGGVLTKLGREGNALSAVLRDAWDGRNLSTLTRGSPLTATNPHLCLVGCITPADLRASMKSTEILNGFTNRFLMVWTDRVRLLPHSDEERVVPKSVQESVLRAVARARNVSRVTWSAAARLRWADAYADLSTPQVAGALSALLARGAPQVRRLSLLYAALDGTTKVAEAHLDAAMKMWDYSAQSIRYIYRSHDALTARGKRLLGALLAAGTEGLDRGQLREVLGSNNIPANEIGAELCALQEAGLAFKLMSPTGGRSREVWRHSHFLGSK
jgi:hypothetical protein